MGEVVRLGTNASLTERVLETKVSENTDISPQTTGESNSKPLDTNSDEFSTSTELKNKVKDFKTSTESPQSISKSEQNTLVDSTWKEVANVSDEYIPDPEKIKIGKQTVDLGSKETIATEQSSTSKKNISINSLSQEKELKELNTGVTEEINNIARLKNTKGEINPSVQKEINKMRTEERDGTIPESESGKERNVEIGSRTSVDNLNNTRASLNDRIISLENALEAKDSGTSVYNEKQKEKISKEIKALEIERDRIDNEVKIVQVSNGAIIRYRGSDFVEIASGDGQEYNQKLSKNYRGDIKAVNDGKVAEDTIVEPTRADAYNEFKARYKAETGKDFELQENQRLVMYKRKDEVIYQIIESDVDEKNNRTTVISREIKETETKKGSAEKSTGLSGIDKSGTVEVTKFNFNELKNSGTDDSVNGQKYLASIGNSLAKEFIVNLSIPGAEVIEEDGVYKIKLKDKDAYKLFMLSSKLSAKEENYYEFLKSFYELDSEEINDVNNKDKDEAVKSIRKKSDGSYEITVRNKKDVSIMNQNLDENPYLRDLIATYKSKKAEDSSFSLDGIKPINTNSDDKENKDLEKFSSPEAFNSNNNKYENNIENLKFRIISQYLLSNPDRDGEYKNNLSLMEKLAKGKNIDLAELNRIRELMGLEKIK